MVNAGRSAGKYPTKEPRCPCSRRRVGWPGRCRFCRHAVGAVAEDVFCGAVSARQADELHHVAQGGEGGPAGDAFLEDNERAGPRPPGLRRAGRRRSAGDEAAVGGNGVVEGGRLVAGSWPPRSRWTWRSTSRRSRCAPWCFCGRSGCLRRRGSRRASAQCRCPPGRPATLGVVGEDLLNGFGRADVGTPLEHLLEAQGAVAALGWLVSVILEQPRDGL